MRALLKARSKSQTKGEEVTPESTVRATAIPITAKRPGYQALAIHYEISEYFGRFCEHC
jgi:hypothetical protein